MALLLAGGLASCGRRGADGPARSGRGKASTAEVHSAPLAIDAGVARELSTGDWFLTGLDVEAAEDWPRLRDRRLTLITNGSALDARGDHVIAVLLASGRNSLADVVLMDDGGAWGVDATSTVTTDLEEFPHLTIHRVTPEAPALTPAMFADNDVIVFDAALPGPRYALEAVVLGHAIEAASLHGKQMVVLDRPPIMAALAPGGPFPAAPPSAGAMYYAPMPMFPGVTTGELALIYNQVFGLGALLQVTPMSNWTRSQGNRWLTEPSPWGSAPAQEARRRELAAAAAYQPGRVELDAVRRFLAPGHWTRATLLEPPTLGGGAVLALESPLMAQITLRERLTAVAPPGVSVHPLSQFSEGSVSETVGITAVDAVSITPVELALDLTRASHPVAGEIAGEPPELLANTRLYEGLRQGLTGSQVRRAWEQLPAWLKFYEDRKGLLLYQP